MDSITKAVGPLAGYHHCPTHPHVHQVQRRRPHRRCWPCRAHVCERFGAGWSERPNSRPEVGGCGRSRDYLRSLRILSWLVLTAWIQASRDPVGTSRWYPTQDDRSAPGQPLTQATTPKLHLKIDHSILRVMGSRNAYCAKGTKCTWLSVLTHAPMFRRNSGKSIPRLTTTVFAIAP